MFGFSSILAPISSFEFPQQCPAAGDRSIDRLDTNGNLIKVLILECLRCCFILNDANKDQCWTAFYASNVSLVLSFASDHRSLICLVKNRHFETHTILSFEHPKGGIFSASDSCFGYRIKNYIKPFKINSEIWTIK